MLSVISESESNILIRISLKCVLLFMEEAVFIVVLSFYLRFIRRYASRQSTSSGNASL